MNTTEAIVFGILGGLIPDLIRLLRYKYKKNIPSYLKSVMFYIGLLISISLGAITAWLLAPATPLQAIACGFSAPEILARLLGEQSNIIDRGEIKFNLRSWWGV